MADSMPPGIGPRIEPRLTHLAEGDDTSLWAPACGAELRMSITQSMRMSNTFTDCDRCLAVRGEG